MKRVWQFFHKLTSPKYFYYLSEKWSPWLVGLCFLAMGYGLIGGLVLAPMDYQQGQAYRLIYLHVPSAFLSMMVYMSMAMAAAVSLIWQVKLADVVVKVSAPVGASFTFLALFTGSIWGKPMWGTWWVWDARLTSELILLFLYLGYIALENAIPDKQVASRAGAILVLVGVVNIPIIHYSVDWWNTLHQPASLSKFAKPSIAPAMLYPLLSMIVAFILFYFITMFMRARCEILDRESKTQWVREIIKE